jgi:hypothetical protein
LRAGQEDAAIEQYNLSLAEDWKGEPLSWLGLAIAYAKAERQDESIDWRRKAQDWIQEHPLDLTSELNPNLRMACQLLLREAEQLTGPQPSAEDGSTTKMTE